MLFSILKAEEIRQGVEEVNLFEDASQEGHQAEEDLRQRRTFRWWRTSKQRRTSPSRTTNIIGTTTIFRSFHRQRTTNVYRRSDKGR
jgi:hypothetical protein